MDARLLAFLGIAALITVTQGAAMAIVTRVALGQGKRAAWLTSSGIVTGLLVWGWRLPPAPVPCSVPRPPSIPSCDWRAPPI